MTRTMWWAALTLIPMTACGSDDAPAADAAPAPTSVLAAMAAQGAWSEDFVWGAGSYVPCQGCEQLVTDEVSTEAFVIHIFERTPGVPASIAERCTGLQVLTESAVDGFDPKERTLLHIEVAAADNDCGWGDVELDYVYQVVSRDADGAPTYVANWMAGADPAAPFPGYGTGLLATPMKICATAPDVVCEPACVLADGPCDLPEP